MVESVYEVAWRDPCTEPKLELEKVSGYNLPIRRSIGVIRSIGGDDVVAVIAENAPAVNKDDDHEVMVTFIASSLIVKKRKIGVVDWRLNI